MSDAEVERLQRAVEGLGEHVRMLGDMVDELLMRVLVVDERLRTVEATMDGVQQFLKQQGLWQEPGKPEAPTPLPTLDIPENTGLPDDWV